MNQFDVIKVGRACETFLLTANTIYNKQQTTHVADLKNYALALYNDGRRMVYLTIEDFALIASHYIAIKNEEIYDSVLYPTQVDAIPSATKVPVSSVF